MVSLIIEFESSIEKINKGVPSGVGTIKGDGWNVLRQFKLYV